MMLNYIDEFFKSKFGPEWRKLNRETLELEYQNSFYPMDKNGRAARMQGHLQGWASLFAGRRKKHLRRQSQSKIRSAANQGRPWTFKQRNHSISLRRPTKGLGPLSQYTANTSPKQSGQQLTQNDRNRDKNRKNCPDFFCAAHDKPRLR